MKYLKALVIALSLSVSAIAFAAPIDINTADAKALDKNLKGVGPKAAAAIVDYRAKNGPFKTADDLAKVKGIGPKLVEKNRANILVGTATAAGNASAPTK